MEPDTQCAVHSIVNSSEHAEPPFLYGSELPDASAKASFYDTMFLIGDVMDGSVHFQIIGGQFDVAPTEKRAIENEAKLSNDIRVF